MKQIPSEVVVTEAHLDSAIARKAKNSDVCDSCVMTVAVRETTGRKWYFTAASKVYGRNLYRHVFEMPGSASIMSLFDNGKYDLIRRQLPLTFPLIPNKKRTKTNAV